MKNCVVDGIRYTIKLPGPVAQNAVEDSIENKPTVTGSHPAPPSIGPQQPKPLVWSKVAMTPAAVELVTTPINTPTITPPLTPPPGLALAAGPDTEMTPGIEKWINTVDKEMDAQFIERLNTQRNERLDTRGEQNVSRIEDLTRRVEEVKAQLDFVISENHRKDGELRVYKEWMEVAQRKAQEARDAQIKAERNLQIITQSLVGRALLGKH